MWTNYSLIKTYNVGDRFCAPVLYYPSLGISKDLRDKDEYNHSIIGGGLLYYEFVPKIKEIIKKSKNTIIWGLGTNTHNTDKLNYIEEFKNCNLVGTRDINTPYEWVPCVSCKSTLFDNVDKTEKNDIIVYRHTYEGMQGANKFKTMLNDVKSIEEVISFFSFCKSCNY